MDYLTVKQFAEIANVTQQAVYKRINLNLKGYIKIENGKKMIAISALKFFNKGVDKNFDIIYLEQQVEFLKKQIQEKDRQISDLLEDIRIFTLKNDMLMTANLHQAQKILILTSEHLTTRKTIEDKKSFWMKIKSKFS